MKGYPLALLARVRQKREEDAAADYAAKSKALLAAREETRARRQALEDYLIWRKQEEDRRYQEVLGKEMSRQDMDEFKAGVASLREKDNVLMEALEEARRAEEEAESRQNEARAVLRQRRKDKEKISAHQEIWETAEAREAERREDMEMEDFSSLNKTESEGDNND